VCKSRDALARLLPRLVERGFALRLGADVREDAASVVEAAKIGAVETDARLARVEAALAAQGKSLYPFQRTGVTWLSAQSGALLADEMGLGKTVQTVVSLPEAAPVVIICPAVAKAVWRRELAKWAGRPCTVLSGRGAFRWPAPGEVVVVNYDILSMPEGAAPAGVVVVADEVHATKNGKAARTQRFRSICDQARAANGKVWLLTATPLLNTPPELWTILSHADLAKRAFGSWKAFECAFGARRESVSRTVTITVWGRPDATVGASLGRVMLRRIRSEVLPDLPVKTWEQIEVDLPSKNSKEISAAWKKLVAEGYDVKLLAEGTVAFEKFSEVRALLAAAKVQPMLDIVGAFEENAEPLVVFSAHRAPIDALKGREGWAVITGDTSADERGRVEEAFQRGDLKGVAATIQAGGVAITLTRSARALFVDQMFTPALNSQAEDRICRIGQTRGCVISVLVANHPLDQRIAEILAEKQGLVDGSIEAGRQTNATSAPVDPFVALTDEQLQAEVEAELALAKNKHTVKLIHAMKPSRASRDAKERAAIRLLQAVAEHDADRASVRNGVGFSGADGEWGHKLARIAGSDLATEAQWAAICRLAHKYRGQSHLVSELERAVDAQVVIDDDRDDGELLDDAIDSLEYHANQDVPFLALRAELGRLTRVRRPGADRSRERSDQMPTKPIPIPIPTVTVTVIVCPVKGPPRVEEIGLSLVDLRRALGGDADRPYVEGVKLRILPDGSCIHLFCDEDGVAFGHAPNPHIVGYLGNVVIARCSPDGEQMSLTPADVLDVALSELSR
jgi:hypothetical protein